MNPNDNNERELKEKIENQERLTVYKELVAKTVYLEDDTALSQMIKSEYERLKKEVEE